MTADEFMNAMLRREPAPAPYGAVCCRCRHWTYAPVPVRYIERQSGPGVTLYACPSHAVGLVPGPVLGELDRGA